MKYINILFIIFILTSCRHSERIKEEKLTKNNVQKAIKVNKENRDTVEGIFSSASNKNLAFVKPETWQSDEVVEGMLFLRDIKSKTDKKILDSIDAYNSLSAPINDNSFIICSNNRIYQYNGALSGKVLLYQTSDREYIQGMNLSQNLKIVAFITWNLDNKNTAIYLFDFDKSKIVFKTKIDFSLKDGDEGVSCSVKWVNKSIVFNINNNLYLLDYDSKQISELTDKLGYNTTYQFGADSLKVVYFEYAGEDGNSLLKYYNIKSKTFGLATFNLQKDSLKVDFSSLISSYFDKRISIFLKQGNKAYLFDKENWKKVTQVVLYKSDNFEIIEKTNNSKRYMIINYIKSNK